MKKLKWLIFTVLKYAEIIILIPILIGIIYHYNQYAITHELRAFTSDRYIKPLFAFLQLSMGMVYLRIIYLILFYPLYQLFDFSFIKAKKAWLQTLEEKPWFALLVVFGFFVGLIIAYAIILNGQ
jgi:hypothetical protein